MTEVTIEREDGPSGGRYTAIVEGEEAEMTYSRAGATRIIIDHTGVPDTMAGRGVARALYENLIAEARAKGFKIVPLCPYVKSQLAKHPEHQDVVL